MSFMGVISLRINLDDYLDRLFDKDEDAFKIVYDETKKGVYAIIISIVKNNADAEDLMQDTYIRMLKSLHTYQKGRNFAAWVMQIAKNIALDHYRKHHRETIHDPQEEIYLFDTNQNPASPPDQTLMEMIQPLDSEERQVVLLRIASKNKFKDIATLMDKPLGTVLWLFNRTMRKLKSHMEKEERK